MSYARWGAESSTLSYATMPPLKPPLAALSLLRGYHARPSADTPGALLYPSGSPPAVAAAAVASPQCTSTEDPMSVLLNLRPGVHPRFTAGSTRCNALFRKQPL